MVAKDFLQDSSGDLDFLNGDFFIGESDKQHIADIVYSGPNWYKEFPQVGVNILTYLSGANVGPALTRNGQLQLQADGYKTSIFEFKQEGETLSLTTDAVRV